VVPWSDMDLEIPPRSTRPRAQLVAVGLIELPVRRLHRTAQPEPDCGRAQPCHGKRQRRRPDIPGRVGDHHEHGEGDEGARGHLDLERAQPSSSDQARRARRSTRGRFPFEQPPLREEEADERQTNRMHQVPRVIGQQDERQRRLRDSRPCVVPQPSSGHGQRPRPGQHQQAWNERQHRRANDRQRGTRPDHRRTRKHRPSREQEEHEAWRHKAAPEVVEDLPSTDDGKRVAFDSS
jgi:hypothetical protein